MNIPGSLKFSKEHEWIRLESEYAYVGITDFAQGELGEIIYVEVETVGQTLLQGDIFGTIEAVKTVSDLYMPFDADIVEFNEKLLEKPDLINTDPYGNGWILKIILKNQSQIINLLNADEYAKIINL
jgi:glycine cleavage system H protein